MEPLHALYAPRATHTLCEICMLNKQSQLTEKLSFASPTPQSEHYGMPHSLTHQQGWRQQLRLGCLADGSEAVLKEDVTQGKKPPQLVKRGHKNDV
eukprot:2425274-Amphidinium_carterae.1